MGKNQYDSCNLKKEWAEKNWFSARNFGHKVSQMKGYQNMNSTIYICGNISQSGFNFLNLYTYIFLCKTSIIFEKVKIQYLTLTV